MLSLLLQYLYLTPVCLVILISSLIIYLRHGYQYTKRVPRVDAGRSIFGSVKIARLDFLKRGNAIISEGYHKYRNSMFLVQTADMERLIISPKYLPELRNISETELSLRRAMSERHFGPYTTVDTVLSSHLQSEVCRVQLTQNLAKLVPYMLEELEECLHRTIDSSIDETGWAHCHPSQPLLSIISQLFARVLVGASLCRDPRWLKISIDYTRTVFELAADLRKHHPLLRSVIYPFLAFNKRLKSQLREAKESLAPLLETGGPVNHFDEPPTILQWMKESASGPDRSPETLVRKALFLCMASIHTSTSTICQALFDLCAHPALMVSLRQEIASEIGLTGGNITLATLNNMTLLDSFLKESQRLNHPGTLSFNRKVVRTIHLSDGAILPAGTFIAMPSSSIALDASYYTNPTSFQPDRFLNQHPSSPAKLNRHSFASTSTTNLAFGYGKYACPGRYFAAAQIKLVLVKLLLEYDISFPEGQVERPTSLYVDERIIPSPTQLLRFRARG